MPTLNNSTINHIRKSVVSHGFVDSADWADGLQELADLSDKEIESIVSFRPFLFPLPLGVTPEIARKDRETFDRAVKELGL